MPLQFTTASDDSTKIMSLSLPEIPGYKTDLKKAEPASGSKNATIRYQEVVQVQRTEASTEPKATEEKAESTSKETPALKIKFPKPAEPKPVTEPKATKPVATKRNSKQIVFIQTIHFVDEDGHQLQDDRHDKLSFKQDKNGHWDKTVDTFAGITVPVIKGYYAEKKLLIGKTVMPEDKDLKPEQTVVYHHLGQVIPIDVNGEIIPNPSHSDRNMIRTFINDPKDATKALKNQKVPAIFGWHALTPTVSPTDPGINIPVSYQKEK